MGYIDEIENKVKDYLDGDYEITETKGIPSIEDVPFKKMAKRIKLCAFTVLTSENQQNY